MFQHEKSVSWYFNDKGKFNLTVGLLESPISLTPVGSKGWTDPGENPERTILNFETLNSKTGEMTDMSMGKSQPAQVKQQLKNGRWWISATVGKNKWPMTKTQITKISSW